MDGKKKKQEAKIDRSKRGADTKDHERKIQTRNALKSLVAYILSYLFLNYLRSNFANGQDDEEFYRTLTAQAIETRKSDNGGNVIEKLLAEHSEDSALRFLIIMLALIKPYIPYEKNMTCLLDAISLLHNKTPTTSSLYRSGGGQGPSREIRETIFTEISGKTRQKRNKEKKPRKVQQKKNDHKRSKSSPLVDDHNPVVHKKRCVEASPDLTPPSADVSADVFHSADVSFAAVANACSNNNIIHKRRRKTAAMIDLTTPEEKPTSRASLEPIIGKLILGFHQHFQLF